MSSGPMCAMLLRILTWCSRKQVTLKAQHISHCSGEAQHALVLGSSSYAKPDPHVPAKPAQSANFQSTQEAAEPKSLCMAPRASAIEVSGFSEA